MEHSHSVNKVRFAVRSGNLDMVKKLVDNGWEINEPDERGWTLLHEAVVNEQSLDIASFLVSAGAIVDYPSLQGATPFYIACKYGCEVMAKMLIESGCNINARVTRDNVDGNNYLSLTPLHVVCYKKNLGILKLLIENDVNINAIDGRRRTAIHIAVEKANHDAVRLLIGAGAHMKMKDCQGYTPLHHACMLGSLEMFNILLEHLGCESPIVDQQTPEGWTLLMLACNFQHYSIVNRLIEVGANTAVINCVGILALHLAVAGELDLFKLLLSNTSNDAIEKCASFAGCYKSYRSIPCIIIDKKDFECLKLLYQSGVSEAVLTCPSSFKSSKGYLISPIGHLLLYTNTWQDNKIKLKFLEFLLSHKFLIKPIYDKDDPEKTLSLIEAVIQMHTPSHRDCDCETILCLILSKISSPYEGLPCKSSRQIAMFRKAAQKGFIAALDLLKYSDFIEPDDVMNVFLEDIKDPHHRWTGRETLVVKFLLEKCTTSFFSKVS